MRAILSVLVALTTLAGAGGRLFAQTETMPVFRSGVELMDVDVTVVDGSGRPVRGLTAADFTVTVDGQPRRVLSAEFVSDAADAGTGVRPQDPDPHVSTNTDRRAGRLIMLAVDRNNIDTHSLRGASASLRAFVSSLSPADRLSLVTVPPPGPSVGFTTNHALVLDTIDRMVGWDDRVPMRFNISDYEALAFESGFNPLAVQRVLFRVCGDTDPSTMSACDREVEEEALTRATHVRQLTAGSVSGFATLLRNLREVEGSKSLIILSQGLMIDTSGGEATSLAALAAESRVSINVLMFAPAIGDASQARVSDTLSQDRDLREAGLESLASRSRGTLFRVVANPAYVFERLRTEISAHYMLGVEPAERDRDGRSHQIRVEVKRPGVQVRGRRQVQYTVRKENTWSRDVLMTRVLRSPAASTGLPMRMSTYVYRDPAPNKVKVIIAAEIDPDSMEKDLDLAFGFALIDRIGNVVASGHERKIYSANADVPIRYDLTIAVDPGQYHLRLAAIDLAGKSGSVERDVQAFAMNQELSLGDLILSGAREAGAGELRPSVVLRVADGRLMTYTEMYTNKAGTLESSQVTFEVADSADGPALQSMVGEMRERSDGLMRQVAAVMPIQALPPGRYLARALFTSAGKTVGKLTRPFEVVPGAARPAAAPPAGASAAPAATAAVTGVLVAARPGPFSSDAVLAPSALHATFDYLDKQHPAVKAATARARTGKLEGTALLALEAGEQSAGSILRGLELLMKGQLDPAANQFGVALRTPADAPLASFYLGVCYALAGNDKQAVASWERARAANLPLASLPHMLAEGWLRLGQPDRALDPLGAALERQPQNDQLRKHLSIAQSQLGLHEEAYATVGPYLERHPSDVDALLVALHALYQTHAEGRTLQSAGEDRTKAAAYARSYADAKGPHAALVEKWAEFLAR